MTGDRGWQVSHSAEPELPAWPGVRTLLVPPGVPAAQNTMLEGR